MIICLIYCHNCAIFYYIIKLDSYKILTSNFVIFGVLNCCIWQFYQFLLYTAHYQNLYKQLSVDLFGFEFSKYMILRKYTKHLSVDYWTIFSVCLQKFTGFQDNFLSRLRVDSQIKLRSIFWLIWLVGWIFRINKQGSFMGIMMPDKMNKLRTNSSSR